MVKQGYKPTEIGVIPEDWEVVKIGESFSFKNGLNKEKQYFGYGFPIVNYMDVFKNTFINRQTIKGKVFVNKQELKNFNVNKGDVLFTRTSETQEEIGYSAVIIEELENTVFSGFVLRGRPFNNLFSIQYCRYAFSNKIVREQIISNASFTTRALTNGRVLSEVKIPLPPLAEQEAIASALSDADAWIDSLEQLIAKKRLIKQGAMQTLLTPKEDWEVKKLGDIGEVRMCKRVFQYQTSEIGEIPFFKIGTFGKEPDAFISRKHFEDFKQKFSYPRKGEVLISAAGTIGRTVVYDGSESYFQDSNIVWLENDEKLVLNKYLKYLLDNVSYNTEGGTIQRLYNSILKSTEFNCPSISEQERIATILSDMDAELEVLETQLGKSRQIKQGMMQELLTGRVRLLSEL